MAPIDSNQATELLRYADIALYEAKAGGRNTWRFYAGDMNAKIIEHRRLESDLRYAIKHGELRLYFQPRIRISDGLMVGARSSGSLAAPRTRNDSSRYIHTHCRRNWTNSAFE